MANFELLRPAVSVTRRTSMETYMVRIHTGSLSQECEFTSVEAEKATPSADLVKAAVRKLRLGNADNFELAEVFCSAGQLCKERRLDPYENPVRIQLMWPKVINADIDIGQGLVTGYRFYILKKDVDNVRTNSWTEYKESNPMDTFLMSFLKQPTSNKEYTDLCNLPDLNERTLLENIQQRFNHSNIYTYVGSILIAVNPFKFFPIYNPKYVKMYQNKRLGDLPPHIFAIADAAFHTMLQTKRNQCIVISGESGSGKTESTNLLLHHLTALSQKGLHGSGVEQTILGAGPVLEAFGNAKTVHNNNSSRFGKFIQVNYKENGMVHGAIVEKYLLEKSRIVSQAKNERNYHVFYYLLAGADEEEREKLHILKPEDYHYLRQSDCFLLEGVDENHEFARLRQSLEMVGFSTVTQKRIFSVLSAVLLLGNVEFKKKGDQVHFESVSLKNENTVQIISRLLKVKERTLSEALTQKKTTAGDETVVMNYRMEDAIATRDSMAKCLYGALFDWIVLKVNQALLAKRHNSDHQGNSIGVLDIFGFEDFTRNSFEQFCINYANEHLQYYFNQHIFKFEQEEYNKEGIRWKNIEFIDNTYCLDLFYRKSNGLFCLLDEECNFPGASNQTLLSKFHHHHKGNVYYEAPQLKEEAFVILHYAGKVKYQITDFREKNSDQIRTDIVGVLKSSSLSFVRELMGVDPVAVLRWAIVKALIRSMFAFRDAGKRYRLSGGSENSARNRRHSDYIQMPTSLTASENLLNAKNSYGSPHPHRDGNMHPRRDPLSHLHDNQLHDNKMNVVDSGCCDDADDEEEVFDESDDSFSGMNGDIILNPMQPFLSEADARLMRRAKQVILKNKSFKAKARPPTIFRDIKTLKAIASRTMFGGGKVSSRQKPPSVGAQFQWSLTRLMSTLNQANPFFIRCIKSNADKAPCVFDDVLVTRQLRYTGMLATVRIRQSGYNYRLTFEEFIQVYKILLPKGLLSSKEDVHVFLERMDLNSENYQIGINKVFLRESEKNHLDEALHRAIMERVIRIQRWAKTILEHHNFLHLRTAVIILQAVVRRFLSRKRCQLLKRQKDLAFALQHWYRGCQVRKQFLMIRNAAIAIQSFYRGYCCRRVFPQLLEEERARRRHLEDLASSASDEGILTKGSSAEELEHEREDRVLRRLDSEESSGIHEDSESDTLSTEPKSRAGSIISPPLTPTSPDIMGKGIHSLAAPKDEYLSHPSRYRVRGMAEAYETNLSEDRDSQDVCDGVDRSIARSSSIFIRRGSQKRVKNDATVAAPLAKQESFSDLESSSPTSSELHGPPSTVSPEKRNAIEEAIKKNRERHEKQQESLSPPDGTDTGHTKSPFRRAKKHFKNIMGGAKSKKTTQQDDSDEELEGPTSPRRPQNLGVAVLPPHPDPVQSKHEQSPKSPKEKKDLPVQDTADHAKVLEPAAKPEGGKIRKKRHRGSGRKGEAVERKPSPVRNWNIAGTSQWQYPAEWTINDLAELTQLDEFIYKKLMDISKDCGRRDTIFDVVFKSALKEFHKEMKSTISVEMQKGAVSIKYRDLFAVFDDTLHAQVSNEGTNAAFPVTMGINAFRGFLDEFRNLHVKKKDKKDDKKKDGHVQKRDKRKKDVLEYLGHRFSLVQFGIPTFCELCSNLIWIMEKGQVCQVCRYTCHKKCATKSQVHCKGARDAQHSSSSSVFGSDLVSLVEEGQKIPQIVEKMITVIELRGLYTVGIYRKSGAAAKVKQLKNALDAAKADTSKVDLEEFPIHVLCTTLKSFFREMPEPLLTFELYDDFLRAAEIKDEKEKIQGLFAVIEKLPKPNHDLFERLMFHLARVAVHESSNKMSTESLAIIFGPCLLRTDRKIQAQESLNQVPRQTLCIKNILIEQLKKLKSTLDDISTLETAEVTAIDRLSVVRASQRHTKKNEVTKTNLPMPEVTDMRESICSTDDDMAEEEERVLHSHIQSIREERDNLTSILPRLECRHLSSDEELLSLDDIDSTYDTADDELDGLYEEYALTFDLPVSPPTQLRHMTKKRALLPAKRPPKKYKSLRDRRDMCNSNSSDDLSVDSLETQSGSLVQSQSSIDSSYHSLDMDGQMSLESSFVTMPGLLEIHEDDDEIMVAGTSSFRQERVNV